jgi:SH3-like domain-containing protein
MRIKIAVTILALGILACGAYTTPAIVETVQIPTPTPILLTESPTATLQTILTPAGANTPSPQTAIILQAVVNVRQSPNGDVVGQLTAGERVGVLECTADWCQVSGSHASGWVFRGCLSDVAGDLRCESKP